MRGGKLLGFCSLNVNQSILHHRYCPFSRNSISKKLLTYSKTLSSLYESNTFKFYRNLSFDICVIKRVDHQSKQWNKRDQFKVGSYLPNEQDFLCIILSIYFSMDFLCSMYTYLLLPKGKLKNYQWKCYRAHTVPHYFDFVQWYWSHWMAYSSLQWYLFIIAHTLTSIRKFINEKETSIKITTI